MIDFSNMFTLLYRDINYIFNNLIFYEPRIPAIMATWVPKIQIFPSIGKMVVYIAAISIALYMFMAAHPIRVHLRDNDRARSVTKKEK